MTKLVLESVQALSDNAEEVLEFLEENVVRDYDMLLNPPFSHSASSGEISVILLFLSSRFSSSTIPSSGLMSFISYR